MFHQTEHLTPATVERTVSYSRMKRQGNLRERTATVRQQGEDPIYIVKPNDNDILLGRGKPTINNIGNQRYRDLVRTRKEEYASTTRVHSKEVIAREVLENIRERGGRFLQMVTPEMRDKDPNIPCHPRVWRVVEINVALAKIKQTLRDPEYVRSSDRQREAVAFIQQQMRQKKENQRLQLALHAQLRSSSLPFPPNSLLGTDLTPLPSQLDRPPLSTNASDIHFQQRVRILEQQRREADLRTQQLQVLIAQNIAASIPTHLLQRQQLFSSGTNQPSISQQDIVQSPPLQSADDQQLRQYFQASSRPLPAGGLFPSALTVGTATMPPMEPRANFPTDVSVGAGPIKTAEEDSVDSLSSPLEEEGDPGH